MALDIQSIVDDAVKKTGKVATDAVQSTLPKEPTPSEAPSRAIPVATVAQRTKVPSFSPPPTRSVVASNVANQIGAISSRLEELRSAPAAKPNFAQEIVNLSNTDFAGERQALREEAGLEDKELRARRLGERMVERSNSYRDQLEALEKNPEGKLKGALNAEINDLERKRSREMADLSFSYNVALGDFQAAEDAVNDRISDMEADVARRTKAYETAFSMVQNDLSESEKLQIQQNFQREMDQTNFEQQKEIALFNDRLARQRQAIAASQSRAAQVNEQLAQATQERIERIEKANAISSNIDEQLGTIDRILGSERGIDSVTGNIQNPALSALFSKDTLFNPLRAVTYGVAKDSFDIRLEKENLLSDLTFLANSAAFEALADFKQRGVTFGQLSNSERDAAGAAANNLVASLVKDPETNQVLKVRGDKGRFMENLVLVQNALSSTKEEAYTDAYMSPEEQLQVLLMTN